MPDDVPLKGFPVKCPKCSHKGEPVKTIKPKWNGSVSALKCANCNHTFNTEERIQEE